MGRSPGLCEAMMPGATVAFDEAVEAGDDLFDRIGAFLSLHGLSADPAHYSFAHRVLVDPAGPIADAVERLTDGKVRLGRQEIEALGGEVVTGQPRRRPTDARERDDAERLASTARDQMASFAEVVETIHAETRGFSRDLAASAAAIRREPPIDGIDEIARITGAMLERVHSAEMRLAKATEEADDLRTRLEEARTTARSDPLTGLPNRRAFKEAFAAHDREAGPLCLAVCDIDRFKRVNDDFGHAVGDRVLIAIGQVLADHCAGHLVARYGGEEFAVLIAAPRIAAAADLIDGARRAIAAKRFRSRETDVPLGKITLSAGVTMVVPGEAADTAFDRADHMLYAAKAEGRDRVHHD